MRKLTATKQIHTRTKKTKGQERGEALTCHWSCRYRTNGQDTAAAPLMPLVPPQDTAMPPSSPQTCNQRPQAQARPLSPVHRGPLLARSHGTSRCWRRAVAVANGKEAPPGRIRCYRGKGPPPSARLYRIRPLVDSNRRPRTMLTLTGESASEHERSSSPRGVLNRVDSPRDCCSCGAIESNGNEPAARWRTDPCILAAIWLCFALVLPSRTCPFFPTARFLPPNVAALARGQILALRTSLVDTTFFMKLI